MTTQQKKPSTLERSQDRWAAEAYREALGAIRVLEEGGFAAMLAGGCVRDRALGIIPKDYDIATSGEPAAVQRLFVSRGMKVIPTGVEHGTVTLVGVHGPYEMTTLRRDVSTDGRRAVVAFSKSFAEDAARRDFTINAMYEDAAGTIHDYFDGKAHLRERRLVFVGDPKQRIQEDFLRILRFFRFWARLGFSPDHGALVAIKELADGLSHISQERITGELLQILSTPHPGAVLDAMEQTGVWTKVLPEAPLLPAIIKALDELGGARSASAEELAMFRLAMILGDHPAAEVVQVGKRLRLATSDVHKLRGFAEALVLIQDEDGFQDVAACMRFVDLIEDTCGTDTFARIFAPAFRLYLSHVESRQSNLPVFERILQVETVSGALRRTQMPLNGKSLMRSLAIQPGPELKLLLENLKERFRRGEWSTSAEGLDVASQIIHHKNSSAK